MHEIKIHITPDGTTTVSTKGFKGKDCLEATKELEKALGKSEKTTLTSEYFEATTNTELKVGGSN